jgi:hypothetical protein
MVDIDKKRIAAVCALEALGYSYRDGEWLPPAAVAGGVGAPLPFTTEALMRRVKAELGAILDLIKRYEAGRRWPLGKDPSVPGGKS